MSSTRRHQASGGEAGARSADRREVKRPFLRRAFRKASAAAKGRLPTDSADEDLSGSRSATTEEREKAPHCSGRTEVVRVPKRGAPIARTSFRPCGVEDRSPGAPCLRTTSLRPRGIEDRSPGAPFLGTLTTSLRPEQRDAFLLAGVAAYRDPDRSSSAESAGSLPFGAALAFLKARPEERSFYYAPVGAARSGSASACFGPLAWCLLVVFGEAFCGD
jgi:hypothetical protein